MKTLSPTSYADVNQVLELLLAEVRVVLGQQFVGMYLYGSLSSGDFHPDASDIDFLVVSDGMLNQQTIDDLDAMHQRIWDLGLPLAERLEGSYLPKGHLPRYEKSDEAYPTVNEHRFYVAPHGSDWIIQRYVIRECGVTLAGPDPKTLIDVVQPDDIRSAVISALQEWWFPMVDDPSWLKMHEVPYHSYAILTMCRALHAIEYGIIVSKLVAADWAKKELGDKWPLVIDQSLATRMGTREFKLYDDAMELIRYTMKRVNERTS